MALFEGFEHGRAAVNGQQIAYVRGGEGPPVLLLHGFPQTHVMWHRVAPALARDFTVVAADLRGYGASTKPMRMEDMSFRAMATDQLALMQHLGFDRFHLVGHDRGGRTAHRLALDAPGALGGLADRERVARVVGRGDVAHGARLVEHEIEPRSPHGQVDRDLVGCVDVAQIKGGCDRHHLGLWLGQVDRVPRLCDRAGDEK